MTDVPLDAETARVWIGGGAKWQDVLDVVTPHGLAPLVGSTPDVSAVGYTLGGGLVRGAYDGPMEEGERHLTLWRDWETPEFDLFGPMTFDRIAEISMDPPDPLPAEVTGAWMASLSDETIDELVDRTFPQDGPPLILFTEMRHAGGALSRGGNVASAYGNREAEILLEIVAVTPTREMIETVRTLTAGIRQRIAPDLTVGCI